MILNEYRYVTRFANESDANEYYSEHGLEIDKLHVTGDYVVVDGYHELDDNKDDNADDKKNNSRISKDFQNYLKGAKINIGENNIIRDTSVKKAKKVINDFQKKTGKKIDYVTIIEDGDEFVKLL